MILLLFSKISCDSKNFAGLPPRWKLRLSVPSPPSNPLFLRCLWHLPIILCWGWDENVWTLHLLPLSIVSITSPDNCIKLSLMLGLQWTWLHILILDIYDDFQIRNNDIMICRYKQYCYYIQRWNNDIMIFRYDTMILGYSDINNDVMILRYKQWY